MCNVITRINKLIFGASHSCYVSQSIRKAPPSNGYWHLPCCRKKSTHTRNSNMKKDWILRPRPTSVSDTWNSSQCFYFMREFHAYNWHCSQFRNAASVSITAFVFLLFRLFYLRKEFMMDLDASGFFAFIRFFAALSLGMSLTEICNPNIWFTTNSFVKDVGRKKVKHQSKYKLAEQEVQLSTDKPFFN